MAAEQETETLEEQIKKLTAKQLADGKLEETIAEKIKEIKEIIAEKIEKIIAEDEEMAMRFERFLQQLEWELDNTPIGDLYKRTRELIEDFRKRPQRLG